MRTLLKFISFGIQKATTQNREILDYQNFHVASSELREDMEDGSKVHLKKRFFYKYYIIKVFYKFEM